MLCTEKDIHRLNALFGDDSIFPYITDDTFNGERRYNIGEIYIKQPGTVVLSPIPECAFVYQIHNGITYKVHANVLKDKRSLALDAATKSLEWMFSNTKCLKVLAFVSPIFENVCRFTEKCGFIKEGIVTKSLLRDGVLYDQNVYGLTKEDYNG